jgi:hypothetical protein
VAELGSGPGDKDLVSGKVTGGSVVLSVRDPPRVVWDEEDRVENPSDKVVDALAGRVALVTTLVTDISFGLDMIDRDNNSRNNPKTGTEKTSDESVGSVESDLGNGEGSLGEVATKSARSTKRSFRRDFNSQSGEERLDVVGSVDQSRDRNHVSGDVGRRLQC